MRYQMIYVCHFVAIITTFNPKMIKALIRQSNIFSFNNFWKSNGDRNYSSVCGGIVSIPLLALIVILLVLKIVQMVNYGIVMTNSQINYSYEPTLTTFSTSLSDPSYSPFMVGFSVNLDTVNCPSSSITYEAFLNEYSGLYSSSNRTLSKVPLNPENCTDDHFGMLPGKMGKIRQWTNNSLSCLPANSYFQIGGSNLTSDLYKNIQFRFACPSSCNVDTCGYVEFFSVSSTVNLGNSSSPYVYSLNRNRFSISKSPTSQTSYQIDSSNMTSDNSILPFSLNALSTGTSLGNIITDIPIANGDPNTWVTIQRSDKTTMYMRSYYKVFDLVAYMGGVIYGILILLFFIQNFSRIQFELNFAAEYFRLADSKAITFRGYLKQLTYEILKNTRWRPDWKMAEQRQQSRAAANRVLDVIYLNKRIAFLQEAISLIFQKHQLKGIHLLHSLAKDEVQGKVHAHRFRDRVVYYMGKKYKNRSTAKVIKFDGSQQHKSSDKEMELQGVKAEYLDVDSDNSRKLIKNQVGFSVNQQLKNSQSLPQSFKPVKLTLKNLITKNKVSDQQERLNPQSDTHLIIHEAEGYYSELERSQKAKKIIVNSQEDNMCLKNELNYVGDLTYEEFDEAQITEELSSDLRRLIQEAQDRGGNQITRRIYEKLDDWLRNYLRDTVKEGLI